MVFHSLEKMTSLFIHLYPPFVFTTITHFIPEDVAVERYPALKNLKTLNGYTAFWFVSISSPPPLLSLFSLFASFTDNSNL